VLKFVFKWTFRLCLLALVLVGVLVLSLNTLLRVLMEHRLRAQTGLEAEIGRVSFRWFQPQVEIRDLKIFNSPEFGGALFLDFPEIHLEYDRAALARSALHLTLVRLNLGELDIVKNEAGRTNLFALGLVPSPAPATAVSAQGRSRWTELKRWAGLPLQTIEGGSGRTNPPARSQPPPSAKSNGSEISDAGALGGFESRTGLAFQSIDVLNVSVGTLKYIDLKDQRHNRTQKIGLENCVVKNVKTPADLIGLAALIGLRSGDFFTSLLDLKW
jgi:hypothetical protein